MSKTILVVEDNILNMELVRDLLETAEYNVLGAGSAHEALEVLKNQTPDLIITDIQLPGLDGCELVKIIKNNEPTSKIKVVAMTAYAMKGDKEKLIDCGFDGYIPKPINTRELIPTVTEYLGD